jgi:AraC-like DNA-binding protein
MSLKINGYLCNPMSQQIEPLLREQYPDMRFIQRILGGQIEPSGSFKLHLGSGVTLHVYDLITDTLSSDPEDKAYLNYFPVEDGKYYLQLSFFPERNLKEMEENYRTLQLVFHPAFFDLWPQDILLQKQPFRFDRTAEQAFNLPATCYEPLLYLMGQGNEQEPDFFDVLRCQESALHLLRHALGAFLKTDEASQLPACRFLNNSSERDKMMEAHRIILENLEHPMTIRELSRQVGINECYLKKGFKATFGKTIHEFQQAKRIEKAKSLLLQGKYPVNEVAFIMGFGSASHFSSTFKKIAGMKPCELLS